MSINIENEVEEASKKIQGSHTYEKELSSEMSPSDDRKSTLPFALLSHFRNRIRNRLF
jgi:hypothetical protein